jgi:hypothetical protein
LIVTFGYERSPLGFSVHLVDVHRDGNSDAASEASWISQVRLSEAMQDAGVVTADNPVREISANSPLRHGTFTFRHAEPRDLPGQVSQPVLRVTSDPGRLLKYLGVAMMCVGILSVFPVRGLMRRRKSPVVSEAVSAESHDRYEEADRQRALLPSGATD